MASVSAARVRVCKVEHIDAKFWSPHVKHRYDDAELVIDESSDALDLGCVERDPTRGKR
jgi:hypothetical protein